MKKLFTLTLFVLLSAISNGQDLDKRWHYMLDKGNTYKSHKVIKENEMNAMWSIVQDSIKLLRSHIVQEQKNVARLKNEMAGLEIKMNQTNASFDQINKEKNEALHSASMVDTYIRSLIIALVLTLLACLFLFVLYKRSNSVTIQKKKDYETLMKSFQDHKEQRAEAERKLKREIQTYMNKFEEIKSKK